MQAIRHKYRHEYNTYIFMYVLMHMHSDTLAAPRPAEPLILVELGAELAALSLQLCAQPVFSLQSLPPGATGGKRRLKHRDKAHTDRQTPRRSIHQCRISWRGTLDPAH